MGRPSSCNTCCTDIDDYPPVTDCEGVIAVVFIDENYPHKPENGQPEEMLSKLNNYLKAFPDRLLFIMDVYPKGGGSAPHNIKRLMNYSYFPDSDGNSIFSTSDRCYSLRLEHEAGVSVPDFIKRDSTGFVSDVYSYITTIVNNTSNDEVINIWKNATQVSVFRDNSSSMFASQVESTYNKFELDLAAGDSSEDIDKKKITLSISNDNEDFICPFSFDHCCNNQYASDLLTECGAKIFTNYDWALSDQTGTDTLKSPLVVDADEDTITIADHGFSNGDIVRYNVITTAIKGVVRGGIKLDDLTAGKNYEVANVTGDTFKLKNGEPTVNITTVDESNTSRHTLSLVECVPTELRFSEDPSSDRYVIDDPCASACSEESEPSFRATGAQGTTADGLDFVYLQTLNHGAPNDFCSLGSNRFGVDLAMSANGDTIVVVDEEPTTDFVMGYHYVRRMNPSSIAGAAFPNRPGFVSFDSSEVDENNDTITISGHGLLEGDIVRYDGGYKMYDVFDSPQGTQIVNLSPSPYKYKVINVTGATFQLWDDSIGAIVDITEADEDLTYDEGGSTFDMLHILMPLDPQTDLPAGPLLENGDVVRYSYYGFKPGNFDGTDGNWRGHGYENLTDDSDPTCHWSARHYTVVNATQTTMELRRGFIPDPDNYLPDLNLSLEDKLRIFFNLEDVEALYPTRNEPILITGNDSNRLRKAPPHNRYYTMQKFTKIVVRSGPSDEFIRPAKICTYQREHKIIYNDENLCSDVRGQYELVDSFLIPDPAVNSLTTRASIDLSDDGQTLIVGSPDNGTLLDAVPLDALTAKRATGEWRVYDWGDLARKSFTNSNLNDPADTITIVGHGFSTTVTDGVSGGDMVRYNVESDGTTLDNLTEGNVYEVTNITGNAFKLLESDGTTVDITEADMNNVSTHYLTLVDSSNWVQRGVTGTVNVDSSGGQEIGRMASISSKGNTVVVSTNIITGNSITTNLLSYSNRGFVYVYKWGGSAWALRGSRILDITSEHQMAKSGYPRDFSISGSDSSVEGSDSNVDYIAISTYGYDPGSSDSQMETGRLNYGAVRVFVYDDGEEDWVQLGNVISPVPNRDFTTYHYSHYTSEPFTVTSVDAASNEFTIPRHPFQTFDLVRYNGALNADFTTGTPLTNLVFEVDLNYLPYEVTRVSRDTFRLKKSNVKVDITTADKNNTSTHTFTYNPILAAIDSYFGNAVCLSKDTSLGVRLAVMDRTSVYVYEFKEGSKFTINGTDVDGSVITIPGHPFQTGDVVRYNVETGGTPLTGLTDSLTDGVSYEVVNVSGNTFKLSSINMHGETVIDIDGGGNTSIHTLTTEKWVQVGDTISREIESAIAGMDKSTAVNHLVTSQNKSPSIAFSKDGNTIIIGDYAPLNEDGQWGLVRTLQLVDDTWVESKAFRSAHSNEYDFGTDILVSRCGESTTTCDDHVFGNILVFSEPEAPHDTNLTFGKVHIYEADPVDDTDCGTTFPPTVTIRCREKPGGVLSDTTVPNNGETGVTEHTLTFELSEAAGDGTSFDDSDIYVTKGALAGFKAMLDTGTQEDSLTHFEATLTVNNSDKDGQVIVKIPKGRFRNEDGKDNRSATFTMTYKVATPPLHPCNKCPGVNTSDYTVEYTAVAIGGDNVLEHIDINYFLQCRDSSDEPFESIHELPTDKSNVPQSLNVLLRECLWCHPFIRKYGDPYCDEYDVYPVGKYEDNDCIMRVFKREFRIMASTPNYDLAPAYSSTFKLSQYFPEPTSLGEPDGDGSFATGDWVREFTTTSDGGDDVNNFPDQSQAIGIPGEKQIISRFDIRRTNDTSGPYAFNDAMTPFELCPAIVAPCLTSDADNWFAFQRLLVSSEFYPSDDKGSIQHYVFNSFQPHSSKAVAKDWLKNGNDWFFEDYPFVITDLNSAHTGTSNDQYLGHAIAPIRSKIPKPYGGTPTTTLSVVPIGYWFMKNLTELEFIEAYGGRDTSIGGGDIIGCSRDHNYGSLHNLWALTPHVKCDRHAGVTVDLDAREISRAQIATDGDGDTVVVSASYGQDTVPVTVLRTYGGTSTPDQSVHEIFSTANIYTHWKPNSLCLNDAGNVLGYTYRRADTTHDSGAVAIYELLGATSFSQKPSQTKIYQDYKRRAFVGLSDLLGPSSNLSVLKMDKSGDNIIVSCTRGKVLTDNHAETTGWAQVFTYHSSSNQYRARGQRLEGTVMNGQFGIDCDISSDGHSVVVSSCEANINGITQYGSTNRHGAIRCYTWQGSDQWVQFGETIRGTNYWSNLGFHLSYEADHIGRIAAFEGTDQNDLFRGAISMYRFEGR